MTKTIRSSEAINEKLIAAGVRNLREFGYPDCNAANIITDRIYSEFFKNMLEENLGHGVDENIKGLLAKITK